MLAAWSGPGNPPAAPGECLLSYHDTSTPASICHHMTIIRRCMTYTWHIPGIYMPVIWHCIPASRSASGTLLTFEIRTFDILISRYRRCNLQYRSSEMTFDIGYDMKIRSSDIKGLKVQLNLRYRLPKFLETSISKVADAAWVSCRPAQCRTSTKKHKFRQVVMEKEENKLCCNRRRSSRTYAVGHPQRRMIVCYDQYDKFQQIPFGAGVEHLSCLIDWHHVGHHQITSI
jgi:hypothetical protein